MPKAGIAVRGVEAFIDLVVCYVIFYVTAAVTGHTIRDGGFRLAGAPFFIGLGLCLSYFVVFEAIWGATLGKLGTQLVVVRAADGAPISWRDAIVRNVMRLLDGLVLYLIGFVAMCLTRKRQRLGDLVAGTQVGRRASASGSLVPESAYRGAVTPAQRDESC